MNDETRARLVAWREEIAAGIPEAEAAVNSANGKLQLAIAAEAAEGARVRDLKAAVVVPAEQSLSTAIATRLAEAVKPPANVPSSRSASIALETAERHVADMREALAQLDKMLAPPSPARPIGSVVERPNGPGLAPFEPVQMPAARVLAPAGAA